MSFEGLLTVSVRDHFPAQARAIWIPGVPRECSMRLFLCPTEVSVRFYFPPQAPGKWNRHLQHGLIFIAFLQLGVCLHFRWACAAKWSLLGPFKPQSIISFIFWLCPHCGVSVRCHFPAQGRRKCKQTVPKTFFSYRHSCWILTLFGGVC